ncbi:MAG: putative toxin-antitoxin system toxin component, PIN family [Pseudonocardia sp.]|nr:putative toxin-antitoxin system toxin component, PIN family [Pseudonocardia sp.]
MRAVLDTNVLFAARISPSGVPARLIRLALERRYDLVVSPLLLDEVAGALARKKAGLDRAEVDQYVARLGEFTMVGDPADPGRWSRDPDDDYLVGLALAANADALVTGDRDLLHLIDPPLTVLTPRAFLDQLDQDA